MTKPQFRSKSGGSAISLVEVLNDETPEQRRAAALTICEHAGTAEAARPLLQALGLTEYVGQTKPWTQRGKIRPVVRKGSL